MKLVIFTKNNARVFDNVEDYNEVSGWPNAIFNPDLSLVKSTPPHFWTIRNNQIVPMNLMQRLVRSRDIRKNGMDMRLIRMEVSEIVLLLDRKYEIMFLASQLSMLFNVILLAYVLGRRI